MAQQSIGVHCFVTTWPLRPGYDVPVEQTRILVVEDEPTVVDVVSRYLERESYDVRSEQDGARGLQLFSSFRPHLVVLDLMLPSMDGMEVCRRIREHSRTPVIMLTARGDEMDRIAGFATGADDYLAKPFSPRELVARVKAVLRRSLGDAAVAPRERICSGGVVIDPKTRQVERNGERIDLTAREFDLLWFLASHAGEVFNREQLLKQVWQYEWHGDPSTVTVHIRRLRTKVEVAPDEPRHIKTVWGVGYRWEA
ncbi:MAG: response regulator transcription factor [Dehalococcoidia bacterium]|nr:response regulator transcription factor [Dehalococcoidia bacterium]